MVLGATLPALPPIGTQLTDLTSGAVSSVVAPAAGIANTASKLYVAVTTSFGAGDPVSFAFLQTYVETYDGSGKPWQWVRQWPIGSLSSVIDLPSGQPYALTAIAADPELIECRKLAR